MIEVSIKRSKKLKLDKKLQAAFEKMADSYVTVGIHEDAGSYPSKGGKDGAGKTVAQVANEMEFGTDIVPARSFMRSSLEESRDVLTRLMDKAIVNIGWNQWSVERAFARIGSQWLRVVQNKVKSNVAPPLGHSPGSQKYLERKLKLGQPGRTLIATGKLLSSLAYKVVLGGQGAAEAQATSNAAPAMQSEHTSGSAKEREAARAQAKVMRAAAKEARKSFSTDAAKQERFARQQATKTQHGGKA